MIEGLIDKRNATLFEALKKDYKIEVELVKDTNEYGCYSINYTSTIYVPESKICADSFTHELLHIYLRSKEIFIGARLKRIIQLSKSLSRIYSEPLLEHIGNCLDHIKMLPIYLDLGFDRRKFIRDYDHYKCTLQEVDQIKKYWKQGPTYNAQAIEFYLEKYFAAKACPNEAFDYEESLKALNQLDEKLFSIQEKLIKRWTAMKIDSKDTLQDDYKMIAGDYIDEMKDWVKSKRIR